MPNQLMPLLLLSGPGSGWSRAGSISGYSASGRCSVGYWGGDSLQEYQEYWADEDAISDLIAIRRVDSKDIVYEGKKKATKVVLDVVNRLTVIVCPHSS